MRLSERAMLIYLSLRVWSAEVLDKDASERIEQENGADTGVVRAVKALMPKDWLSPLTTLKGTIRTKHYALTSPWLDSGYRIVSTAVYSAKYQSEMTAFLPQWDACVESTLDQYADARERGMKALGSLSDAREYPTVDALRGRFVFSMRLRNVPDSDDFRMDLDPASIAAIKDQAVRDERATIERTQADAASRMRQAVEHMRSRIDAYSETDGVGRKLYESTVGNVRELVDLVPLLDVSGDSKLAGICAEISQSLCRWDVDTLKTSASLRDDTARKASEILERMKGYGF